jgi:hypothetical protein
MAASDSSDDASEFGSLFATPFRESQAPTADPDATTSHQDLTCPIPAKAPSPGIDTANHTKSPGIDKETQTEAAGLDEESTDLIGVVLNLMEAPMIRLSNRLNGSGPDARENEENRRLVETIHEKDMMLENAVKRINERDMALRDLYEKLKEQTCRNVNLQAENDGYVREIALRMSTYNNTKAVEGSKKRSYDEMMG